MEKMSTCRGTGWMGGLLGCVGLESIDYRSERVRRW